MKIKSSIRIFILLFPVVTFSQKKLTQKQALEDYTVFKNVITTGHPSLYEYTSKAVWDSLFIHFENQEINTIKNSSDLYKSITHLSDYIRDGHLIVMRPALESIPKMFPLLLKIIDDKFYTDTDDFGIPVGSEIVSIDNIKGTELRNKLLKYAPSDGYNTTKKDRQIEREFGILHFYEFGTKTTYQVEYKTPTNEVFTKDIKSQPFESIGNRFANRHSYYSNYHNARNKREFVKSTLGKEEPFLYFVDSLHTAVLTMNSFGLDISTFESSLKDIFKKIRQKKAEHLIIDIRQNKGGYPLNAIHAFSYIANKPFKQRISQHIITSSLPEEKYSKNIVNGYTYETFFEKYFKNASKKRNEWILETDENESSMIPHKKRFNGKTYVIIGGKTFSAGSGFALNCKNEGITLVGQETGGGYYIQTGQYPMIYELPNSKIKILISFVKVKRYVKDNTIQKGSGVLPDLTITLSVQDLIDGKDSPLDYLLTHISKNKGNQ